MLRIGLTGGIAAGKSTAAARFGELGAVVVDHDLLARAVVEPGSAALADLAREFGDRVIAGGRLDRALLASIVFEDESARRRLNAITHPYIRAAARAADKRARAEGQAVVVHDIPLLVESGQGHDFDLVVTIAAPLATRLARLMGERGLTHEEALARVEAQASDEERASIADIVLDGGGAPQDLVAAVDAFWAEHIPAAG